MPRSRENRRKRPLGLLPPLLLLPGLLCAQGPVRIDEIQSVQGVDSPSLSPSQSLHGAEPPGPIEGASVSKVAASSGFGTGFSDEELAQICGISQIIGKYYVDTVDKTELMYGALEGMAKRLDPHSEFLDPKAYKDFHDQLDGSFSGVGLGMKKKETGAAQGVSYVIPGSPAEEAGLQGGDEILAVDGEDIRALSQEDAAKRIKGAEGTRVSLSIRRPGAGRGNSGFDVALTRRKLQTANAFSRMHPGGIGYVYLESFRDDSSVTVLQEVRQLERRGMRSLVLDVRNNGGGSLQAVINLAAAFLKEGMGIVSTKDRRGRTREWKAPSDGEFSDVPIALLVNGYSASASEILAGALQDNRMAVVVGGRSYGKGSAQVVVPFQDGSALKLTVDRWVTPSGRSIQKDKSGRGGITPDVPVQIDEEAEMKALVQIMRELNRLPPAALTAPDPALVKALELLR